MRASIRTSASRSPRRTPSATPARTTRIAASAPLPGAPQAAHAGVPQERHQGLHRARSRELASRARALPSLVAFNRVLTDRHPDIAEPMLQEYLTAAETSIFSVSGFVAERRHDRRARRDEGPPAPAQGRHRPLLRGPRARARLVEKLAALCKKVGYHGAFESEFIVDGDRRLLIDFNPRFYSQMGFDIARGLSAADARVARRARRTTPRSTRSSIARAPGSRPGDEVYCHKTMLDLVLASRACPGRCRRTRSAAGDAGTPTHRTTATDAVRDPDDRMPAVIDAAQWVQHFAKHPRSFVRSFVLNR